MVDSGAGCGDRRSWGSLLPALAFGLGALFLLVHFDLKPVLGDEGVTAVDAWRISLGELPQRDFFEIVPPLSAGLLSWAFSWFGASVVTARALGVLYGVALLALTWLVSRRLAGTGPWAALPLAVLVPFGVGAWPFPSHHWLADIALLAALLALLRAVDGGGLPWAAAGGAALAAACFALQDQGGLGLLAALAPLPWISPGRRGGYLAGIALGGLALAAAVALLWLPWDPATLWHDWFLFPASQYRRIPDNAVGLWDGWAQLAGQWDPRALAIAPFHGGAMALASTFLFLLPLAFAASAWPLLRKDALPRPYALLLLGLGAAFLGTALHRWSLMNLIWAAPLPAVAVAALLRRGWQSPRPSVRRASGAAFGVITATFLLAGLFRVAFVLRVPGHTVQGPAGSYRTFNPNEAVALQEFLDAVEAHVPRGEGAFVRGYLPLVSFLSQRPNPTPFTFYLPSGYQTASQAGRLTAALERGPVRWGLSADAPFDPADPADVYLARRYRVAWRNGTFALLERRP